MDHREDTRRLAKNTGYMFIRLVFVALVGFYTSRVVLKTLGVDDFGLYNIVGSLVVYLSFLKNALNSAAHQFFTFQLGRGDREKLNRTFVMNINVNLLLALVLVVLLEAFGPWMINHHLRIPPDRLQAAHVVFQFSLLIFFFEIVRTPFNCCILAHERMNFYSFSSIVEVLLKLLLVILLARLDYDKLILYAMLLALVSVVIFLWYFLYCRHFFSETRYHWYWDPIQLRKMLNFSGWSLLGDVSAVTVTQSINFFFNWWGTVAANAAMGVANQVNGVLLNLLGSFSQSYNPQMIKSYAREDRTYFFRLIDTTSRISFFLIFAISFPLMVYTDFLLGLWLENPPELASVFVRMLLFNTWVEAFSDPLTHAVFATGRLKRHQIIVSVIRLLTIPTAYLTLRRGVPLQAALLLMAFFYLTAMIVRVFEMKRVMGLDVKAYFENLVFRMLPVALLSCVLPLLLARHADLSGWSAWVSAPAFLLVFLACYIPLILAFGLTEGERKQLYRWIREHVARN